MEPTPVIASANIGLTGRRLRRRIGWVLLAVTVGLAGWLLLRRSPSTPWPWRLLVFFPLTGSLISLLEARRSTCIVRAAAGTIEDETGGTTPAPACDLPATRRAAVHIVRDAVIIGAVGTAVLAVL
jgi:hypothetical protein